MNLPDGYTIKITTEYDQDPQAPWKKEDFHGPVTDWVRRDKHPGEMLLCSDLGSKRYYDFQAAVEQANREGWGISEKIRKAEEAKLGRPLTQGEVHHLAAMSDFERLRDWCNDEWWYVGVIATLYDPDGNEIDHDSVWGVNSDSPDYIEELGQQCADVLVHRHGLDGGQLPYAWNGRTYETLEAVSTAIAESLGPVVRGAGRTCKIKVSVSPSQ